MNSAQDTMPAVDDASPEVTVTVTTRHNAVFTEESICDHCDAKGVAMVDFFDDEHFEVNCLEHLSASWPVMVDALGLRTEDDDNCPRCEAPAGYGHEPGCPDDDQPETKPCVECTWEKNRPHRNWWETPDEDKVHRKVVREFVGGGSDPTACYELTCGHTTIDL